MLLCSLGLEFDQFKKKKFTKKKKLKKKKFFSF